MELPLVETLIRSCSGGVSSPVQRNPSPNLGVQRQKFIIKSDQIQSLSNPIHWNHQDQNPLISIDN